MKKYLFMIAAACVLLACAKEAIQKDSTPEIGESAEGNISFVVNVESASDVKATISASDNFTWQSTDRAKVYTSEGSEVILTPTDIDGCQARFTGNVPSGETVAENAIVVYPASFLTGPSTVTFPASYTDGGQGTVLAAKVASGSMLTFKYLAATIKATITDVPSIATSITVTSNKVLTGAHTIGFSGSTPSLSTSSTAKEITFSSPAKGNCVLTIPVPTPGEQTLEYTVKYSSTDLFTQSTTKTFARNTYLSMAPLAINPEVYIKGKISANTDANWDVDFSNSSIRDKEIKMVQSGTTYTTVISLPDSRRFRLLYRFPDTEAYIDLGPASSGVYSGTLRYETTNYLEASKGTYSLSFNSATGALTATKLANNRTFYITSNSNSWAFDNARPMVSCLNNTSSDDSERAFFVGVPYTGSNDAAGAGFKVYDCSSWKNSIGASSVTKTDGDVNWAVNSDNNVYVANPGHVYTIVHGNNAHTEFKKYDEGSTESLSESFTPTVVLKGNFAGLEDKWADGYTMNKVSPYNKLFYYDITVTGDSPCKVFYYDGENDHWYGFSDVNYDGTSFNSDGNIGLYHGNWRIYFNAYKGKIHVFRLP